MRPERAVIPDDIICDRISGFAKVHITCHRYSLILQAFEEAFHRAVIPTVSASAHTLLDPVTP